ncbi:hypothetical protein [Hymenobacter sp.]|uniref:hypothetical protein n=1 Tax=Hymenobacter sp. TaxID=1898978 RepID=UPI002ED91828
MEQLLVELERVPWGKVAADQRNLFPLSTKDSAWLLLDWLPRATKHNLYRYVAILSARDIFCRLAMHSLTLHAQTQFPVVYRLFEEEENAVTWLLAQN